MKILRGKVSSGIGDFSQKITGVPGLWDAYERKTGMRFFPGTLNIRLKETYSVPPNAIWLDKEEYHGTVSVYLVPCLVFGRKAFILRTEKNERGFGAHPKNIVEVACDVKLREAYKLVDGTDIEVTVDT
jgi:riboflavin kinase